MSSENIKNEINLKNSVNAWTHITKKEKHLAKTILIAIIFTCITAIIITAILKIPREKQTCVSLDCLKTSASVLGKIDLTVDPCEEFYNYACGNFLKSTIVPIDSKSVNIFSKTRNKIKKRIQSLLSDNKSEDEIEPFKLVKNFFKACMNVSAIEKLGFKSIHQITSEIGGWPVLREDTWIEYAWNLEETIIHSRSLGLPFYHLFEVQIIPNEEDNTKYMISIKEPYLYAKNLLEGFNNTIVQEYYKYIVDVAVLLGANRQNSEREMKKALDFEIELAKIISDDSKRNNSTLYFNPITIKELNKKYENLNWMNILKGILNVPLSAGEIINESVPNYFSGLDTLLSKTPKRTVANYILWKTYSDSIPFLAKSLKSRKNQYLNDLGYKREMDSISKECIDEAEFQLNVAVSSMYVRKYLTKNVRIAASDILEEIRKSFRNFLVTNDWMDDETKEKALIKLDKMITRIGYPDDLVDDQQIINYYKDLKINESLYFDSVLNVTKLLYEKYYGKFRDTVDRNNWQEDVHSTGTFTYHSSDENRFILQAGILQSGFFSSDLPNYMNYGALGYIIAKKMTFGFNDVGSKFSFNGSSENWWSDETENAYLAKTNKIIEQYDNYIDEITGENINGSLTKVGNIADNGGVKIAYFAYKNWVKKHGMEQNLPGLQKLTSNQMFWISFAQTLCSKEGIETPKTNNTSNRCLPNRYQVIGALQNNKEFSEDFKCQKDSFMNPLQKYEVW